MTAIRDSKLGDCSLLLQQGADIEARDRVRKTDFLCTILKILIPPTLLHLERQYCFNNSRKL
jgi:hypothetical protein